MKVLVLQDGGTKRRFSDITSNDDDYFAATYKGCEITIELDLDLDYPQYYVRIYDLEAGEFLTDDHDSHQLTLTELYGSDDFGDERRRILEAVLLGSLDEAGL